jgi:hypothetical protein
VSVPGSALLRAKCSEVTAQEPVSGERSEDLCREAGDLLGEVTDGRSLAEAFFKRNVGRLAWLHCSASSASLVQVRAMSSRMSCTRLLGARSASECIQRRDLCILPV